MSSRQALRIAYVLHTFPELTENFVFEEVAALRAKGVDVSIFAGIKSDDTAAMTDLTNLVAETTYLRPFKATLLLKACWLSLQHINHLKDIYKRVLFGGNEGLLRRFKAFFHSIVGIYLALLLKNREISHIHANHGYFASWIAMVAARMLEISFSITFHGSDLLIDKLFLDLKVNCSAFCFTISEYNKRFLIEQIPGINPDKVIVYYLGINIDPE